MTAVIIVGGVLSGIFTVTESGAFGTIYAFLVTIIVYRALTWEKFKTRRGQLGQDHLHGDDPDCLFRCICLPADLLPGAGKNVGISDGYFGKSDHHPVDDQSDVAAAWHDHGYGGADSYLYANISCRLLFPSV